MPVLKTLGLRGMTFTDTRLRANSKRVFSEAEWEFLHTLPTRDLESRIAQGDLLINLLNRPDMINMNGKEAEAVSSNLRFQQDAIRQIISSRKGVLENG